MSSEDPTPADPTEAMPEDLRTGNAQVDGVLASLEDVTDLPVADQVAVFERAHEQLRGALDATADD